MPLAQKNKKKPTPQDAGQDHTRLQRKGFQTGPLKNPPKSTTGSYIDGAITHAFYPTGTFASGISSIVRFLRDASFCLTTFKLFCDNQKPLIRNGYNFRNTISPSGNYSKPLGRPINTSVWLIRFSSRTAVVERKAKSSTNLRKRLSLGRAARNSSVTDSYSR